MDIASLLAGPEQGEHALRHAAALRIGLVKTGLIRAGGASLPISTIGPASRIAVMNALRPAATNPTSLESTA